MANGHGGKREGAGRPAGSVNKTTAELKEYCQEFSEDIISMLAQLAYYSIDPRVRIMAGKEILDRGHGRAPQGVEVSGPDGKPIESIDMTNKELARLAAFLTVEADNDKAA